jgi:hypothetical protein
MLAPFIVGVGLMVVIAGVHAAKLAVETFHATRRLLVETPEQRRIDANGDCGTRGYGYLRRVIERLPDPTAVPLVRYHGYDAFGALVLPFERRHVDGRVLVGIDLRDEDMVEQLMACRRLSAEGDVSSWLFRADSDIDTLLGFRIDARDVREPSVDVTLFDTPQRRHQLARWHLTIPPGANGQISLRPAETLKPFSVHNRSVGFLFDVERAAIRALDLLVIPVDARGYTTVHTDGGCTTAVRADLLADVHADDGPWRAWIDSLDGPR